MELRGLPRDIGTSPRTVAAGLVEAVSSSMYRGNVKMIEGRDLSRFGARFRIGTVDLERPGWRYTSGGLGDTRRSHHACWFLHRDVLAALFAAFPLATVRTGFAVYKGAVGFEREYPDTAFRNIGSDFAPVTMPDLCGDACDHFPGTAAAVIVGRAFRDQVADLPRLELVR